MLLLHILPHICLKCIFYTYNIDLPTFEYNQRESPETLTIGTKNETIHHTLQ